MEIDSFVIADWPRGLCLAKELSAQGNKTAYLEITPYLKNPFPLFLEDDSKEKDFLENLGFLSPLEKGLCFLNSESVFFFKELARNIEPRQTGARQTNLKFKTSALNKSSLKENLYSYLGQNLAGRVFQFNNSFLSEDSLPLFSDCFLFEPSLRKKEEFEKNQHQIHFSRLSLDHLNHILSSPYRIPLRAGHFSKQKNSYRLLHRDKPSNLQKELLSRIENHLGLSGKNIFCLSERVMNLTLNDKADFQWKASFFSADLGGYESVIPEHFFGIKQLLFPWCYDNLMSVFQKKGILEVWMRLPVDRGEREFIEKAQKNLESFFPGAKFQFKNQALLKSFYVYGEETLSPSLSSFMCMQNSQPFSQVGIAYDIKKEIQFRE